MATSALADIIPGWELSHDSGAGRLDADLLARAYHFSERAHTGQRRRNGDRFVTHCVEVAKILADLQLDSVTVASGMIHDVVEDTATTVEDVEREFGREIAQIVDGLTKIGHLPMTSNQERQVENYRKLLLSIAKDIRVILIKLADRLHNMRTLEHLDEEKRVRIAQETRDLYAPLAHRFGLAKLKAELEDLSFKFLETDEYRKLAKQVVKKRADREKLVDGMAEPLKKRLSDAGIKVFDVSGRPKNLWSIWKKMQKRDKPYEEIYDLLAIRVLVDSVQDCYHTLGVIHGEWTPLQERIKDYIASPKSNGYQSLHTTIFGPRHTLFEIQIRTADMHRTAEYGIAAHWLYKSGDPDSDELDKALHWFRQVIEMQLDAETPDQFLELLKLDLYQDEIFVFTPAGDVIQLPRGATPLDFAFAVHTEVGVHTQGAKVNGRLVPLSRELRNSETVEIVRSPNSRPSRDWLEHVRTGRARHKIRQWLRIEETKAAVAVGQEILEREIKRRRHPKLSEEQVRSAAGSLKLNDHLHLYASIAQGDVTVTQVLRAIYPDFDGRDDAALKASPLERLLDRVRSIAPSPRGLRIQGVDGLMVRYAQCCQPVPGDTVVGYVTRGRGVSVHRGDCPNLLQLAHEPERRLEVDWQKSEGERFLIRLAIEATDRRGLYADLATAVSETGTEIRSLELKTTEWRVSGAALVEVENLAQLTKILKAIRKVKGVSEVARRERLTAGP